jgi:predicted DCC family thiol-disulfide oxidoreductase YuxK
VKQAKEDLNPRFSEQNAIVLFDGYCNFCCGTVDFIIQRDTKAYFFFTPLQSRIGQKLLQEHMFPEDFLGSLVLLESGSAYSESTAALRIAHSLRWPWNWTYWLILLPRSIRDSAYRWFGERRYRWFGKRDTCILPSKAVQSRFLAGYKSEIDP